MKNKFICTGDWHLRIDKPRCRLDDDWMETQKRIIDFIFRTAEDNKADIIHSGDLFDQSVVPDSIKNMFLESLFSVIGVKIYLIAGNHDLYYNNPDNINKKSFGVIWNMIEMDDAIRYAGELGTGLHYGMEMKDELKSEIIVIHKLTYEKTIPPFIKNGVTAQELLDKFPDAKWIFTGDNHKKFIYENKGRYVINPGCVIRQSANEMNYEPSIYLIDFDKEKITEIKIPDRIEMVTDEYITNQKERDERIGAFVELVKGKTGLTLSFKDALLNRINESDIGSEKNIIKECMEEVYG